MPQSQHRRERSSTIKNRKSRRKVTRTHLLEQLEDRRLLAVASPPDQPLDSLADSVLLSTGNFSPGNAADLVNVARDGQIAVTNNGNDNTWETAVETVHSGEVLGGSTGLLGNDPFDDLVLQTGATIEVLASDGSGGWVAQQTVPYTGTTDVSTHADTKPSLGFLNSDFALDFVAPLAQSNQVAIFLGSDQGFSAPTYLNTGASGPVAVAIGDVIGGPTPDILVGHTDGTVSLLEGTATGWSLRTDLVLDTAVGSIQDIDVADFDGDGHAEIIVLGELGAERHTPNPDPLSESPIRNGDFSNGLSHWSVTTTGQASEHLSGRIHANSGFAQLVENHSFLTSLSQSFLIPDAPETIEFDLVALGLDVNSTGEIPDAFEVSLLGSDASSLVPTHRSESSAFVNFVSQEVVSRASGVSIAGTRVTLDISGVTPGTEATLIFDLIGHPEATRSTAAIDSVSISPGVVRDDSFDRNSLPGTYTSASDMVIGDVNGDGRADIIVSDSARPELLVLNGDDAGSFVADPLPVSGAASALAIGPITSPDSILDLAVGLTGSSTVLTPILFDTTAPTLQLVSPSPAAPIVLSLGGDASPSLGTITLQFSEQMFAPSPNVAGSVTNPASYQFYNYGPDGVDDGGLGDDVAFAISSVSYDPITNTANLSVDQATLANPLLSAGALYNVVALGASPSSGLRDLNGNYLDNGQDVSSMLSVVRTPMLSGLAAETANEGSAVTLDLDFGHNTFATEYTATINWGDGTSTTADVSGTFPTVNFSGLHTYADNGNYEVVVEVQSGGRVVLTQSGDVVVANVAPAVAAASTLSGVEGTSDTFLLGSFTDAGFSNPTAGSVESFTATINWGDGTTPDTIPVPAMNGSPGVLTSGNIQASHAYGNNGAYTATVTLTDDDGGQSLSSVVINVANAEPVLQPLTTIRTDEGLSFNYTFAASDLGTEDALTANVDWGDGTTTTATATLEDTGWTFAAAHTYADDGSYNVVATISDDETSVTASTTAEVLSVAPAILAADSTAIAGETLTIAGIQISDPGFSTATSSETFTATIDWGDGSEVQPAAVDNLQPGSEGVATRANVRGQHTYAAAGVYTATVTVTDDDGASSQTQFAVQVTDAPQSGGVWLPTIDFERDADGNPIHPGELIGDQWAQWGVHVSSGSSHHPAMIFDSAHPTGCDYDLGTPNRTFGGPGYGSAGWAGGPAENSVAQNNVLIISQDRNSRYPNDYHRGGDLIFNFDNEVMIDDVGLLDLDHNEHALLTWFDAQGNQLGQVRVDGALRGNGQHTAILNARNVSQLVVHLSGSGAVTNIVFCRDIPTDLVQIGGAAEVAEGANYTLHLDQRQSSVSSWGINWGDGNRETIPGYYSQATHVYADGSAEHAISATATLTSGNILLVAPHQIVVSNVLPQLTIAGPTDGEAGSPYTLSLNSDDPGQDTIQGWIIDWGDDTEPQEVDGNPAEVTHIYAAEGNYQIQTHAFDEDTSLEPGQSPFNSAWVSNVLDVAVAPNPNLWLPTIDFERQADGALLKPGDRITDQFASLGMTVSTLDPSHPAMIFDSSRPSGGDKDLGTPNKHFRGPGWGSGGKHGDGANQHALENVLIISEDNHAHDPDDNQGGGTLVFDFDRPAMIDEVHLLDITNDQTHIRLLDANGTLISDTFARDLGANSFQVVELFGRGVARMEIVLAGDGAVAAIVSCIGADTIDPPSTRFFVVDRADKDSYRYSAGGSAVGDFELNRSASPRGAATTADGNPMWVVSSNKRVHVYDTDNETELGNWFAKSVRSPEGIATDGTHVWIVDAATDRVYKFTDAASRRSGYQYASSSFKLTHGNSHPKGITTDGEHLWVVDSRSDKVFVYDVDGNWVNWWNLDPENRDPAGLTILPGQDGLWVVDSRDDAVYAYDHHTLAVQGSQQAASTFDLAPGNNHPEGIADPAEMIDFGQLVTDSISVPGEIDEWSFAGTAGASVNVDFTQLRSGPLTSALIAPDGSTVYTRTGFSRINHDVFDLLLDQTGDYTLRLSGSGNYSFVITETPAPIVFAYTLGTVESRTIDGALGQHNYEFTGSAGQEVFLDWISLSGGATVRLVDPAGTVIASGSGLSTTNLDRGWIDLTTDGTYTLEVQNGSSPNLSYSFELAGVPGTRIFETAIDKVISGTLESTGSRDHWVFDAVAGQSYFFDMNRIEDAWLRARLVAPDGTQLFNRLDFVEGNFDFGAFEFDQTGQYRIELSADRGGVASYEMRVWSVPDPDEYELEFGKVHTGSIETPGRSDLFTFDGVAGQKIYLDMQEIRSAVGSTQQLVTELVAPDGSVLFSQNDFLSNGHDTGPFVLPIDGQYTFRFSGRKDNTTNYQFRVNDLPQAPATMIAQEEIVTGAIDFAGQSQRYTLTATAGQTLTLDLLFNQGFSPATPTNLGFTVLDPAGAELVTDSRLDASFNTTVDGTYTIIVDDANVSNTGDDTGRYDFRITTDANNPVPDAANLQISNVTATRRVVGSPAEVLVSWTVTNSGSGSANANWIDRVSFSAEEDFGGLSIRDVADVSRPVALAPGESYQQSAMVTLPESFTGEFWAYVQPDVLNHVYEDQAEYEGAARAASPTSVFAEARQPTGAPAIELAPEDGSRYPAGSTLALTGNAAASKQSINAIFVVDVSASTLEPNGLDANFDGLLNDKDDINNYPNVGDVLDAEIAATLRLAEQLATQSDDLQVATIIFAGGSEPLDSGAGEYNQIFVDPNAVNYAGDRNLEPDFDFAMKSLWSFTTGFTTSQGAFYFRDMQVDSGTLFDPAMRDVERLLESAQPADRTLVYMLTDGQGLDATAVDVAGVADQGVEFYAFQIGAPNITAELSDLVASIDSDASSTATAVAVANPEDLTTQLLTTLDVESVTINGTPVDALDPAGNFFSSVTLAPGENQFTVTATSASGRQSTETLTLYGDQLSDVLDNSALVPASDDIQSVYSATTYNRHDEQLHVRMQAINLSETDAVSAPLVAVAQDFAPSAAVSVSNPESELDGKAAWTFDTEIAGDTLAPGDQSDSIAVALDNPLSERFGPNIVFLSPAATAPVFASVPELLAPADQVYSYAARVLDADGDAARFSLLQSPPGMTIVAQTGQINWTPTTADAGYHSIKILADDGRGGTAQQQFTLLVPNALPNNPPLILTQPPSQFVTVGDTFTYQVTSVDPDGDPVSLSLGSATPSGVSIESGRITWTPSAGDLGLQSITVIATDNSGATGSQAFDLRVLAPNVAPTFVSTPVEIATAGLTYRYTARATDADDRVEYSLAAGPTGLRIDASNGVVVWQPATGDIGTTSTVVIRATDARGLSTDQVYDLLVAPDTESPRVAIQLTQSNVSIGESAVVTVSASDNVAIDSVTLTLDGQAVALDANNQITITPDESGVAFLVATATDTSGNSSVTSRTLLVLDPSDTTPPVVVIESPSTSETVTYLTDVFATVTDDNLYSYTLEYSRRHDNSWQLLNYESVTSGAPIELNNELAGLFDPTLLQNDQYELRLTASDVNGNTSSDTVVVSLDGGAKIGVNVQPVVDLTIPVAGGPPISIYRQHSQLTADLSGDFGNGWQFCASEPDLRESVARTPFEDLVGQFAALAFKEGDKVYITTPDCMRVGFTFSPVPHTGLWTSVSDAFYDPRWIPDPGHDWSLYGESDFTTITGVASGVFDLDGLPLPLLRTGTGEFILGAVNASYNPLGYELINKQGVRYSYDQDDGLEQVTDRNGNTLTYTDAAITSSSGQQVQFQRDDQGRITTLIDPQGNQTNYTYDAAGNLINVDYPEGLSNSYHYTAQNFLAAVNPENIPAQESITTGFEYDVAGRLAVVFDALGATNQFAYDLDANTRVTADALGHPTTMTYDDRGNMTSETSPNDDTVFYEYNSNDNVTRLVDERGFETLMTYDANRNLTSVTDALNNTTEFTYNTLNDIVRMVDADGGIHEYDFNNSSNMVAVRAPGGTNATIQYDAQGRVTAVTDVEGRQRLMSYGSGPYPTQYTERDGTVVSLVYDAYGHLMQYTGPRGHSLTISMDDRQRPTAHTDALGNSMQFEFDGARVTKVIDELGNATEYILDGNDRPIQIIDPEGGVMVITYDANGRKSTTTDANGFTTSYQYRPDGRLESMTNAQGGITRYEYDPAGNRTAEIDAGGNRWQWEYDALGYVTASITPKLERTEFTYDNMGNLTSETDALGRVTTYEYGDLQLPTKITDPAGGEIALTYDWEGNLLSESDKNGNLTTYTYDALNRMLTSVDPLGNISFYQYDASGNQIAATDRRGNTTSVTYDELDRPVSWTDPTGAVLSAAYDAKGRLISMTDPTGATRSYAYDSLGRLTAETDPLGGIATWTYDAVGNVLSATDPIGRTTTSIYDSLHRRISMTDPLGATTSYVHDAVGNVVSVTDPEANTTTFAYDQLNRIVSATDALGNVSTTSYNAVGYIDALQDRNGRLRSFTFDALDRPIAELWIEGGSTVNSLSFSYDAVGNILTAADGFSAYAMTYDALNRPLAVNNPGTPGLPNVVLTHTYDASGNRTNISDNAGVSVESTYDVRNLLASRTWSGGSVADASLRYGYDSRGLPVAIQRYASLDTTSLVSSTSRDFDAKGRLTDLTHFDPVGNALVDYDYVRDLADQLITETHHGRTYSYTRDAFGQLTGATVDSVPTESYTYDANGNRTTAGVITGADNRLLEDDTHTFGYDAEGNLIVRTNKFTNERTEYEYDHRNRMTQATDFDSAGNAISEVTNIYDVFDRQIGRIHDADAAGPGAAVHRYTVYDGPHAWADYDESGTVLARYMFGDGIDEITARWRPAEGTTWYLSDHLGTVRDHIDATGTVTNTIEYDSFGRILAQSNAASSDRFTFTGREYDEALDLYYYRARFYDPSTGRFLSQDPLGFAAGDTNLYRYVGNNPLDYVDPSGNLAMTECAIVRYASGALNVACPVLQTALNDGFDMEGLTPAEQLAKGTETAFNMLNLAFGTLPFGSGPATQLILKAVTITTTAKSLAGTLANGHLFTIMGMAETYAREAYRLYDQGLTATFGEALNAYHKIPNKPLFWSEIVCGAANMALMVYSARARCFVEGTPVVVGILPPAPNTPSEQSSQASVDSPYGITILDCLASVAIAGALAVRRRKKQPSRGKPMHNHPVDDYFSELDEQSDAPKLGSTALVTDTHPISDAPITSGATASTQSSMNSTALAAGIPARTSLPVSGKALAAGATTSTNTANSPATKSTRCKDTRSTETRAQQSRTPTTSRSLLSKLTLFGCLLAAVAFASPRILQLFGNSSAVASSEQASRTLDALPAAAEPRLLTKAIEDIRCGDRIPSQLPEGLEPEDEPEPDPATWRLVELEVDKPDGTRVEVKLLRPLTWLQQAGAIEHGTFPLNVEELDIDGEAAVLKILPCPPIQSGEGQVVTGTFRHTCDDLVQLHIQGEPAPIVCTSGHPIWSEEAQDFVTAASLDTSSVIRLVSGELTTVIAASRYSQENTVCNIEVRGTHVYHVGFQGVTTHNTSLDIGIPTDQELFWLFGAKLNFKDTDVGHDGVSIFRTGSTEDVKLFIRFRGTQKGNHAVFTREQLTSTGLAVPESDQYNTIDEFKGRIRHHSVRPATSPDPNIPITRAELEDVISRQPEPSTKVKPAKFLDKC